MEFFDHVPNNLRENLKLGESTFRDTFVNVDFFWEGYGVLGLNDTEHRVTV